MSIMLDNIRHECRNFIRNGTPLPKRDSRWDSEISRIMAEEQKIFDNEHLAEIETMYANYHKKHITGITYEEWMDKAKKLYKVSGSMVYSIARGPDYEKEWGPYKTEKQAHKKFLQLISYKNYDHFVRQCDFAYNPDEQ